METLVNPRKERGGIVLPLSDIIHKNGYMYVLRNRGRQAMIYEQVSEKGRHYEVFKIRYAKATILPNGKYLPDREIFPPNESFGVWSWSCTLDRALIRYLELEGGTDD